MERLFEILLNALPEAIGGLIAAGIIALLSYLFVKRLRKESPQEKAPQELLPEPALPEIYSNLPSRTEFIGRKKEMERIKAALSSRYFLICIDGIGGIGKTSLALEVIHECLRFSKGEITIEQEQQGEVAIPKFDGFIWTSAKDRELRLNDILDAIARTLDWPGIAQQPYLEKIESVRKLLQTKPYLLIVDNFETITDEAVRDFLLKIPEPSKVLITSREQKLPQAWAVSIKGLEQDEALALIRNEGQRLGLKSVEEADDTVLLRLYQATGGAPLAIKWSVGQIKQKGQSLDTVLAALHDAKGDIFEEVFARSWSLLTEDAQKVLMVMPIFASSASRDAIEAASDVHHFALDEALGQLVQMWLVEVTDELETAKRRYSVHPLTRAFGNSRLVTAIDWREKAMERIAEFMLNLLEKNMTLIEDKNRFSTIDVELPNILVSVNWCYEKCYWQRFIEFHVRLDKLLTYGGYYDERIRYGLMQVDAAKKIGEHKIAAECAVWILGWTYYQQDSLENSVHWLDEGLKYFQRAEDEWWIATTKKLMALVFREKGDFEYAEKLVQDALESFERMSKYSDQKTIKYKYNYRWPTGYNASDIPNALLTMGGIAFRKGDFDLAKSFYEKSFEVFKSLENKEQYYHSMYHLGMIALEKGQFKKAIQLFQDSLDGSGKINLIDLEADSKFGISLLKEKTREYEQALELALEALKIYECLGKQRHIRKTQMLVKRLKKLL